MSEFEVFEGKVAEIIYSNCTNGYTVCVVENDDEAITATGCMPYLAENDDVKLSGKWVTHPEYGRQFSVKGFEKNMPSESSAILKYLSSGVIRGVRLATAKKIVDKFGDDTLNIIMTNPGRLSEIKGISYERALEIGEDYSFKQGTQSIIMFLQNYGIGSVLSLKIYRRFGAEAVSKIKENPYVLSCEVSGISFRTSDKIAFSLGMRADDNERIKAGIIHILNENAHNLGHTYLPKGELINQAARALGVEILQAENALTMLMGEAKVFLQNVRGEEAVFLESMLLSESLICRKLLSLVCDEPLMREDEVLKFISKWEKKNGTELAEEQKNAVILSARSGAVIITGGPGTGKTTVVNAIIDMFDQAGLNVALTAPTGRAAKRLSELTKRDAKTIHRLLEVGYADDDDIRDFVHNETNPLEQDAFIVDEASMIDVNLGSSLLRAVKLNARVIFVGDADQLPSVGAGNMLSDIINSKKVPVVRLNVIFRQAEKSMIVRNAHRVIDGLMPLANQEGTDFFFIGKDNIEEARETVCRLCDTRIPKAYGFDPVENIQVLCPTRKTDVGTMALNVALQRTLNPFSRDKNEYKSGSVIFREGDRIMHTKNNYELEWESISGGEYGMGVFNGDMGFVEKIDIENRSLYAVYEDKRVVYDLSMLDEIEHCYAITVHKSQGSEFDVVIMPVYNMSPFLMRRNLFYTAITRAKSIVILVGKMDTVAKMVINDSDSLRYTSLKWRLENS